MEENTDLIVLHTTKYGENAVVVHTLSRRYGRRGFLVRGLGKKPVMSLLQPLNLLEADVTELPCAVGDTVRVEVRPKFVDSGIPREYR